jgi:hypothetical protein
VQRILVARSGQVRNFLRRQPVEGAEREDLRVRAVAPEFGLKVWARGLAYSDQAKHHPIARSLTGIGRRNLPWPGLAVISPS